MSGHWLRGRGDRKPVKLWASSYPNKAIEGSLLLRVISLHCNFEAIYDGKKRRMPDYVHTGTPLYFTIHEAALEKHHNLDRVYMLGISELPL